MAYTMARKNISKAKLTLLAVKLTGEANIPALQTVISQHPKVLDRELLFRILLSYLPESLESVSYLSLIEHLVFNTAVSCSESYIDISTFDEISEEAAKKSIRKLRLLPLAWPHTQCKLSTDSLVLFLTHRCLRIDECTGLITEIPALLDPFVRSYPCLLKWMISTVLPLIRLCYEYYRNDTTYMTIHKFETLNNKATVSYLLSNTQSSKTLESDPHVGRDLRGLIGPWLHRETKNTEISSCQHQPPSISSLHEGLSVKSQYGPWEETYLWIVDQAKTSWKTAVDAIGGWNGPGDYDLSGYEVKSPLKEEDELHLKQRYIRIAISIAYSITEASQDALKGIHRLLVRITSLMGVGNIPSLESACTVLMPVNQLNNDISSQLKLKHLNVLTEDDNPVTAPTESSVNFLNALLVSATLCERFGCSISVRHAALLVLQKDEHLQSILFHNLMLLIKNTPKEDDGYFKRVRHELLWLRSWGLEDSLNYSGLVVGKGIFGRLSREMIEIEFLKVLLSNARYSLAGSLYNKSQDHRIPEDTLCNVITAAALSQYDNATNSNISRGGLKRCNDILNTFPQTLVQSSEFPKIQYLLQLTSKIEPFRLVLKKGEPFRPVSLRIHKDPIMVLGNILEQNPKSYLKIDDFIEMAHLMALAGLIKNKNEPDFAEKSEDEIVKIAERRVVSMCIDSALSEDDFETAYFYIKTRLKELAVSMPLCVLDHNQDTSNQINFSPRNQGNDWLWRAALQAGKYRQNMQINQIQSTNDEGSLNQEINYLEKRMDCIAQALVLAPKETLQEILSVYRRCEEELESLEKLEAEQQEEIYDTQASDQKMPGGFIPTPSKNATISTSSCKVEEEEPISLFDLSRAGIMRAQSGLSALSMLKSKQPKDNSRVIHGKNFESYDDSDESVTEIATGQARVRKRDQLKNAAVGGLASGVGWLIGAPVTRENINNHQES